MPIVASIEFASPAACRSSSMLLDLLTAQPVALVAAAGRTDALRPVAGRTGRCFHSFKQDRPDQTVAASRRRPVVPVEIESLISLGRLAVKPARK